MSTLIICLPPAGYSAVVSYDYAVTTDGRMLSDHASAPPALLPAARRGSEVVAVVPASVLSWHAVQLPQGMGPGSPRLRAVLDNLLEEKLLDEPAQLHLALAPRSDSSGIWWVAACDKAWLREHLQALESAGCPVSRLVPEFEPETGALQWHVIGEPDLPQLLVMGTGTNGVLRLPLSAAALALVPHTGADPEAEVVVQAEPALAALAEQLLQRPVNLLTRSERWLDAAQSAWDLAQFDLVNSSRTRTFKRLSGLFQELLQAPAWRPARWGAALLLLVNLIGLNAWAWNEQSMLQTQRRAVQATLMQTFPQVKVVVDAPLQMEREVAALRQATGAASGRDLEAILTAVGRTVPADRTASGIDYSAGQARIKGLRLSSLEASGVSDRLTGQGYSMRLDGDTAVVKQSGSPDAAP